jgi:hypothetical protein
MTEERARKALEAQGFKAPGPKLIEFVTDVVARAEEGMPAGWRRHQFDAAELLADTPELLDRTEGTLKRPRHGRVVRPGTRLRDRTQTAWSAHFRTSG